MGFFVRRYFRSQKKGPEVRRTRSCSRIACPRILRNVSARPRVLGRSTSQASEYKLVVLGAVQLELSESQFSDGKQILSPVRPAPVPRWYRLLPQGFPSASRLEG